MSAAPTVVYVDVTSLLNVGFTSGIQRVVREIVARLQPSAALDLRLLRYDRTEARFEEVEADILALDAASTKTTVTGRGPLSADSLDAAGHLESGWVPGSIFLDLDAAWNAPLPRQVLYPELSRLDVRIVSYVYDLVPLEAPETVLAKTMARWLPWLAAVAAWSDLVLTDSRSAERDFLSWCERSGASRVVPTLVTRLGWELPASAEGAPDVEERMKQLDGAPFLLVVGTVEPRKRTGMSLAAFDLLHRQHPDLQIVFVGRQGWLSTELARSLETHPLFGTTVHWWQGVSDDLLHALYREATVAVYLSQHEGFGLPIAEALGHGAITVAPPNSSMFEVGREATDYTWYESAQEVADTVDLYLRDPELARARREYVAASPTLESWDTVAGVVERALSGLHRAEELAARPVPRQLQLVVFSTDVESLQRAISLWDERSDLPREYLVVCPTTMLDDARAVESSRPVTAVDEQRLLAPSQDPGEDPVARRFALRAGLVDLEEVDSCFVLLEDDDLPLGEVTVDDLITPEGRHVASWFDELDHWAHRSSDFDTGQRVTALALARDGLETLAYASHQPQPVLKELLAEAVAWARGVPERNLCEWATYFNHAATTYPTLFLKRRYRTLGWPPVTRQRSPRVVPTTFTFERYDRDGYENGTDGPLLALEPASDPLLKIDRVESAIKTPERSRRMLARSRLLVGAADAALGPVRFERDGVVVVLAGLPRLLPCAAWSGAEIEAGFQVLDPAQRPAEIVVSYEDGSGEEPRTVLRTGSDRPGAYEAGQFFLHVAGGQSTTGRRLRLRVTVDGSEMAPDREAGLRVVTMAPGETFAKFRRQLTPRATQATPTPADPVSRPRGPKALAKRAVDRVAPSLRAERERLHTIEQQVGRVARRAASTTTALEASAQEIQRLRDGLDEVREAQRRQEEVLSEIVSLLRPGPADGPLP